MGRRKAVGQRQRRWEPREEEWKHLKLLSILLNLHQNKLTDSQQHRDSTYQAAGCFTLLQRWCWIMCGISHICWPVINNRYFIVSNLVKPSVCSQCDLKAARGNCGCFCLQNCLTFYDFHDTEILQHDVSKLQTGHSRSPLWRSMPNDCLEDWGLLTSWRHVWKGVRK